MRCNDAKISMRSFDGREYIWYKINSHLILNRSEVVAAWDGLCERQPEIDSQ